MGDAIQLDRSHREFLNGGLSIVVAAHDAQLRPLLAMALACRAEPSSRSVKVLIAASQCPALLDAVRRSGDVAVVCTEFPNCRTIQLKGRGARVEPSSRDDCRAATATVEGLARSLVQYEIPTPLVQAMLTFDPIDVVAIVFEPEAAFSQTPGPRAGVALTP